MPKLHELTGQITNKELSKVYNKKSPYYGNICHKLTVTNDKNKEEFVFAYPNLVSPEIIHTIENSHYIDKRYLFFCEKKPKRWVLHKWEELRSNGSDFNKSQQLPSKADKEKPLTTHDQTT